MGSRRTRDHQTSAAGRHTPGPAPAARLCHVLRPQPCLRGGPERPLHPPEEGVALRKEGERGTGRKAEGEGL